MEDILTSIKAGLYERASSPLAGALAISWLIWNVKLVLIVLFADDWWEVSTEIDAYYQAAVSWIFSMSNPWGKHCGLFFSNLVMPSLLAAGYIYGYPKVAAPVYEHTLQKQRELKALKLQVNEETPISFAESQELHRQIAELNVVRDKETQAYRNQVAALTEENERLREQVSSYKQNELMTSMGDSDELVQELIDGVIEKAGDGHEGDSLSEEVSLSEAKVLMAIGEYPADRAVYKDEIKTATNFIPRHLTEQLTSLFGKNMIVLSRTDSDKEAYRLSSKGRAYLESMLKPD